EPAPVEVEVEPPPVLFSTLGGDPEVLALLETFIERLPQRVATIETSLARSDMTALAGQAHQLKGTAGGYGFPILSEAAAKLEASVKGKSEPEEIRRNAQTLVDLCHRVRVAPQAAAPGNGVAAHSPGRHVGG